MTNMVLSTPTGTRFGDPLVLSTPTSTRFCHHDQDSSTRTGTRFKGESTVANMVFTPTSTRFGDEPTVLGARFGVLGVNPPWPTWVWRPFCG